MPKRHEDTSLGGAGSRFETTEWTKLLSPGIRKSMLDELCRKYWRPVYSYLRHRGFNNEQAKDLTQGFFTEKILSQDLVQKADRNRGRFRTFLLTAVKNYVIDLHRTRGPMPVLGTEIEKTSNSGDPEVEFDIAWAEGLLEEVLRELEAECQANNKYAHWHVFRRWLVEPAAANDKVRMNELCRKYGIQDASTAYNIVSNLKRRFRKILRRHLRHYVESDAEVDHEISTFIQLFQKKR